MLFAADAIIPMDPALPKILKNAGIVIEGDRIAAVAELSELRRRFGNLTESRHRGILLPGLVNAHTHLELSYQSANTLSAGHFTQWVSKLMATYPPPDEIEAVIRNATRKGARMSLMAGVTTLGDISRHSAITRSKLADMHAETPITAPRVVSFGEVMGLGKLRARAAPLIESALPPAASPSNLITTAISPHAPYTVEGPTLRACVRAALLKGAPIAMHLAENLEEIEFLSDLAGPFGIDWDVMLKLDIIDKEISTMPGGPIRWAQRWGLLLADAGDPRPRQFPVLLAHVNYCDNGELAQLAVSRASVAYCPRTHEYFKHPPHRYRDMLESGINVCLGTDSLASNPDLSILREAQLLLQRDQLDPYEALAMITRRGADALGLSKDLGSLTPGKLADVILLTAGSQGDGAREIVEAASEPSAVWIGGCRVV